MAEGRQGGRVQVEVKGATANQAWRLLEFCSLDKLMTGMESCTRVEGVDGEPGCVRYCVAKPVAVDGGEPFVSRAKEKLLTIDPAGLSFSYEVTENNLGLRGYTAEMKVVGDGGDGCRIEWSFAAEDLGICGTKEAFAESLQTVLRGIAQAIEVAVAGKA